MAHVWELDLVNFDYYFFDENCSFRLMELLEVARPEVSLTEHFPVVAIPVDTAKVVERAGMVESVFYRPSNQARLKFNIDQLSPIEQAVALDLSLDTTVLGGGVFSGIGYCPPVSRSRCQLRLFALSA